VETASAETRRAHFGRRSAILATTAIAVVLLLAYIFRPITPLLRVSRIVQITKSGGAEPWQPLYTDGPRLYYRSLDEKAATYSTRQVLLNGNEDTPVGIPRRFVVQSLSPDDTEFLVTSVPGIEDTVWRVPIVSVGSPRRVGNLVADDIVWSHDGKLLAFSRGTQLFLANEDGTVPRPLASVPVAAEKIDHLRWSPDDRQLRFTVATPATETLWSVEADGHNLHELLFNWPGASMECCGEWTRDGRYFVFKTDREGISNLWALEEKTHWSRRANRDPIQLTFGPMNYSQPTPSRDGRTLFAIGAQPSGELLRYNPAKKHLFRFSEASPSTAWRIRATASG